MPNTIAVVVNFNGLHFLRENLDSLVGQSVPFSKILVIDNNSRDGSREYLKTNSSILTIEMEDNLGFASGANRGVESALKDSSCEAIALINNDVRLDENWHGEARKVLSLNEWIGSCSTLLLQAFQPHLVDTAGITWLKPGLADNYLHGQPISSVPRVPIEISGACAAAALYRREFFQDVGLFDESLFAYQEDVDLSLRGSLRGWLCYLAPKAQGYHHGLGSNRSFPGGGTWADFYNARNRLTVLIKSLPQQEWRQHGLSILGLQARLLAGSFRERRASAVISGLLTALFRIQKTLFERSKLMAGKTKDGCSFNKNTPEGS